MKLEKLDYHQGSLEEYGVEILHAQRGRVGAILKAGYWRWGMVRTDWWEDRPAQSSLCRSFRRVAGVLAALGHRRKTNKTTSEGLENEG